MLFLGDLPGKWSRQGLRQTPKKKGPHDEALLSAPLANWLSAGDLFLVVGWYPAPNDY